MFNGDRQPTAEFFLTQLDRFLTGVKQWDCDQVSYAEIQPAALFLCEDEAFQQILKRRWSAAKPTVTLPSDATHLDFALEVAHDLISGFFEALTEYMEAYKGKLC